MSFKIGVVGGTRGVGRLVVEQALERGWTVNALARNPVALDDLKQRFPELLVVTKGDVLDPASDGLDQILSASQSVVISLGSSTIMRRETTISGGTRRVLERAQAAGVNRVVKISSWGVKEEPEDGFFFKYLLTWMLKYVLEDHRVADADIQKTATEWPALDWTIVRPPGLTNGPLTKAYTAVENKGSAPNQAGSRLSRADVAFCVLDSIEKNLFLKTGVAIGSVLPSSSSSSSSDQ